MLNYSKKNKTFDSRTHKDWEVCSKPVYGGGLFPVKIEAAIIDSRKRNIIYIYIYI